MRIMVTGGAGYIGSHLIQFLLKKQQEILCKRSTLKNMKPIKVIGIDELSLKKSTDNSVRISKFFSTEIKRGHFIWRAAKAFKYLLRMN